MRNAKVRWVWDFCRTQGQPKFTFWCCHLLSQSAKRRCHLYSCSSFPPTFNSSPLMSRVSTSLPFLIPSSASTVLSECLVDKLGEYDSAAETTAHVPSFSYPPLVSPSPFSCCSISSISVLTEAHFRWSVLLRHAPFSSARTSFFTYPTRPSHP